MITSFLRKFLGLLNGTAKAAPFVRAPKRAAGSYCAWKSWNNALLPRSSRG